MIQIMPTAGVDDSTAEDELIIEQNLAQLLLCIKELKPVYQEDPNAIEMSYQEIAGST
jgi:RNA polymerase sigma-70 factor (ECF subfamily)